MRFSTWFAGNSWKSVLDGCRHAERTGWDGVWVPDHFMAPPDGYGAEDELGTDPERAPILEAWTMLAAIAALVPRLRIGAMVTGNTYRHPAVLANMAATVDQISNGRLVLGIGSGWQENEHEHYGIELGTPSELSDRLAEACAVLKMLLSQERTTFAGTYYQLDDAPCEPKPVQQPLPLLIGGGGERRTLRTVARFADEWNVWGTPSDLRHKIAVLEQHCATVGRDPSEIQRSAAALLVMTDSPEEAEQLRSGMEHRGGLVGTIDQLREIVAEYAAAGVDELVIPDFTMTAETRADTLDRFRAEVIEGR
ncbi:MAG: TIGR03560 family F420-dependent LLM class oxidoreductase [Acidimicrobiales bacterium]